MPVSTREPGEESIPDNRVSLMLPFLPVDVADPVERLAAIQRPDPRAARPARAGGRRGASPTAAELGPFPSVSWGLRLGWRLPQHADHHRHDQRARARATPLYGWAARLLEMLPYVPIADRVRIGVAMFSYRDTLTFGITGDFETTADLDVLATGIADSLASCSRAQVSRVTASSEAAR